MKILQMLFISFSLFFASHTYAGGHAAEDTPPDDIIFDSETAILNLPPSVLTYDKQGFALAFKVKNPNGIGRFRFNDTCLLNNGSPVKFLAAEISKDDNSLDTELYVEYMGGVQPDPRFRSIKTDFCPEHAILVMPLQDYHAFHEIASQIAEEKKYLRTILGQTSQAIARPN